MGIFDKFKKDNAPEPVELEENVQKTPPEEPAEEEIKTVKVDLSSSEAVDKRLKEIYETEKLYILLTAGMADLERGISIPMVLGPNETEKVILIFTDYKKAVRYLDEKRPAAIVDGVYPIGEIIKSDKIQNIDVICANALALGITAIDFDVDDENGFGCKLPYFMQVNKMDGQGQIVLTKEEMEKIKENDGKFAPRFNAMYIVNFTNPYALYKERADEVMEALVKDGALEWAKENAQIHELCYGANRLMSMASQEENKKSGDAEKYIALVDGLNEVIFDRLSRLDRWHTLENRETGELFVHNGIVYIVYTTRYANRLGRENVLKAFPPSVAELAYLVGNKEVKLVAVTDGPNIMHVIDRAVFGF